jgi:phage-related protein (TIGR01555 family)
MAKNGARVSRKILSRTPVGDTASVERQAEVLAARDAMAKTAAPFLGFDNLKNFVAAIGTSQDKRSHTHYAFPLTLTRVEIENMFRSSWLAKRIVRTPADDMCRSWVDRTWDGWDKPGDTSAKVIKVAEKKFNLRGKVNEALSWGRLYGGAGIVVDIKGQEDWGQPLELDSIKKGSLRALHVFDRWRLAATGELDQDRSSPNYGYPKFYTIGDPGMHQLQVHWSRVVKFQGEPLPWFLWIRNAFWQDSVLQHVAEVIRDYDATMAGIASLVYEANVDIITSPGLASALAAGGAAAQAVIDRYALSGSLKSINHMMLLDGGPAGGMKEQAHETYTQKTTAFSGLKDVAEKFMINVSGAADIPITRLFGQSPAGLSATGESDTRNYYDRLSSDQERQLRHPIERLDEILFRSTLGFMPEDYELTFRPLWQMTDAEKAEIELKRAQRDQIYLVQGVVPEHVVTSELLERNTYAGLTQAIVELVKRMEALAAAQPAPGKLGQPAAKAAPPVGAPQVASGAGHQGEAGTQVTGDDIRVGNWFVLDGAPVFVASVDGLKLVAADAGGEVKFEGTFQAFIGKARDVIREEGGRYYVYSEVGKRLGGPYATRKQAGKRLGQVEFFKHKGA